MSMIYQYLEAVAFCFAGIILGNLLPKLVEKLLKRKVKQDTVELAKLGSKYLTYMFFSLYALSLISDIFLLKVISLFFIALLFLLFIYGLFKVVNNLFFYYSYKSKIKKGMKVKYNGFKGVIKEFNFSLIAIQSKDETLYLPISFLKKVKVIESGRSNKKDKKR